MYLYYLFPDLVLQHVKSLKNFFTAAVGEYTYWDQANHSQVLSGLLIFVRCSTNFKYLHGTFLTDGALMYTDNFGWQGCRISEFLRLERNEMKYPKLLNFCLSRIDQTGIVRLICLSRIDQAGKGCLIFLKIRHTS